MEYKEQKEIKLKEICCSNCGNDNLKDLVIWFSDSGEYDIYCSNNCK